MSMTTTSGLPQPTIPYGDCALQTCPITSAQLPYAPNLAGNGLYLSIFAFCLVIHLLLGIWFRTWGYMISMVTGCVLEVLGYVGRVQMHFNPFPQNPFLLYLICVTIASVFFTAAIYLCLAHVVVVYGEHLSVFRPRTYTITFIICDFISLLLQAGGGTIVSMAESYSFSQVGVHIAEAGLIFQVASLILFMALCVLFFWSCKTKKHLKSERFDTLQRSKRFRWFLWALSIATVPMLTRCAFRIAELSGGFKGHIWFNERDYMILEGALVSLCVLLLTVGHPGLGFSGRYHEADFKLRLKKGNCVSSIRHESLMG